MRTLAVRLPNWLGDTVMAVPTVRALRDAFPEARVVLAGPWAMFVWLRLLVGLVFPIVIAWAAVQTARTRSMESATGLLYIAVGAIAAGTILAAGLYFGAGMLV